MPFTRSLVALLCIATTTPAAAATRQAAPAPGAVAFDVASIKENTSVAAGGKLSGPTPGRFTTTNMPLRFIMLYAYDLRDHQLVGAPDWTSSVAYDITATYPEGLKPTESEVRLMLQRLLADRFGLRIRREQRELPTYDLVLARRDGELGPQLKRSQIDCENWLAEKRPQLGAGGPSAVMPDGKRPACMMLATRTYLSGGTRTIAQLTMTLQSMVRRPVIDRTGLIGTFDIDLRWADATVPASADASTDVASIFTAVQEQLGLRLEPSRAPADVVVIEAVQRPTAD